ncbi:MAG: hypothetical protein QW103_00165 [Candidatus Pacearchaeota archaeon]
MIIAECGGGLGNQLNIYAATRALAKIKNASFKIDNTFYENWQKEKILQENMN